MLSLQHHIQGLYAVTPDTADTAQLCQMVEAALQGGVNVLQYRNKLADKPLQLLQARALLNLCQRYQTPLIINDDVALAKAINADGVHLGASDGEIKAARALLGDDKIIGASCYNQLALAEEAVKNGASYVAFGACFASSTKPNAPVADHALFSQAAYLNVPRVAIGGITLANAHLLKQAGADAIAVINALFSAENITKTATEFNQIFNQYT